jgi:hypothetical protein
VRHAGVGLVPPVPSPVRPAALALPDTTGHNNTQGHLQAASPSKLSPNRKSARPSPKRQKAANAAQQAAGVTPRKGTAAGTGGGVGGSDAAATSSPGQPLRQQVHTTPGGPDEGGGAAAEGGAGGVVRRTSTTTTATTTNSQVGRALISVSAGVVQPRPRLVPHARPVVPMLAVFYQSVAVQSSHLLACPTACITA